MCFIRFTLESHIVNLFLLSDQVSNLDSSEPKSDVLPVTPSDNFPLFYRLGAQIYVDFFVFKISAGNFFVVIP